jgi:hypothetical protein
MATWVILGACSLIFFCLGKNTGLKRRVFPWFIAFAGVLFVTFGYFIFGTTQLKFMIPAIIIISYLNITGTLFCDKCGQINTRRDFFQPIKHCSKCGHALNR